VNESSFMSGSLSSDDLAAAILQVTVYN
jgi:hypothetical protein